MASLLLSAVAYGFADALNPDGIFFLEVAQVYLEDGLNGAFSMYRWPFYSVLIGLTGKAFGIGLELAAYLVNSAMLALLSASFVQICREVISHPNIGWFSALVILSLPTVNEYRDYVIRDIASWSLITVGVLYLLRFSRTASWRDALGWQVAISLAFLFRMESLIFAALGSVSALWLADTWRGRAVTFLKLTGLAIAAIAGLLLATLAPGAHAPMTRLEELARYVDIPAAINEFSTRASVISLQVLDVYSAEDAGILLAMGLVAVVLLKVVTKISVIYSLLIAGGLVSCDLRRNKAAVTLLWLALAGLLMLIGFAFIRFYISGRYTITLSILLAPFAAIFLCYLFDPNRRFRIAKKYLPVLGVLIAVTALDPFVSFSPDKAYLKEAGTWTRQSFPASARLLANYPHLYYYSGRRSALPGRYNKPNHFGEEIDHLEDYDLMLVRHRNEDMDRIRRLIEDGAITEVNRFGYENTSRLASVYRINRARAADAE